MSRLFASLLALLVLSLPARTSVAQWISPGALAADHADIDGAGSCTKCHAPGAKVEPRRCVACHTQIEDDSTYHARLVRESGRGCRDCHSDHKGRRYPLIRWSPPASFDHGRDTGFELSGAHARVDCGRCHDHRPGYMGAKTDCASCHEDPHEGDLGRRCERCHDTDAFRPASEFDHDEASFTLSGAHGRIACGQCHQPASDGHVRYKLPGAERCDSCHRDPHQGRTSLSACADCHVPTGWADTRGLPPAHSPAGFPLVGKHADVSCADCHGASLSAKVSRRCASCHTDPHDNRFGSRCESCHNEAGWSRVQTANFDHDKTRYPLRGKHRTVACERCHTRRSNASKQASKQASKDGPRRWRGLRFDRCDRCHQAYHEPGLQTVASETRCESCHSVAGFDPSRFDAKRHEGARFVLDGSHLATPCAACHIRQPPAPTPLVLGEAACADCHDDPHDGAFDDKMTEGVSCEACHQTTGWKSNGFDHDATAFPLRGVHAAAACASCHGEPAKYKGTPKTCVGCHTDAHAGQFTASAPVRGCEDCHTPSDWKIEPFDHAERTGWEIDGRHTALDCDACHQPVQLSDALTVTQYRLGYRSCESCHDNPHGASERLSRNPKVPELGGDCARCHRTEGWHKVREDTGFDHALTGFALRGRHAQARCVDCHGEGLKTGETRAACASCHTDPHRGELGDRCETCHDARGWTPSDPLLRHRETRFPLVGTHAVTDCTACHVQARQDTWRDTPTACFSCHETDYRTADTHPSHVEANFSHECDRCHSQYSFLPARFKHDVFWPLRGAHAGADCFECHVGERYGGTPRDCISCHEAEYLATTDPPHAEWGMDQRCQRCHRTQTWTELPPRWHNSVFPTSSGPHSGFDCADCHIPDGVPPSGFTCTRCHTRSGTDRIHLGEVSGYRYESGACLACHPRGRG